jgi:aspartate 1-decarboxylase
MTADSTGSHKFLEWNPEVFMRIHVLKSKIHTARVTEAKLHYEGSIEIDADLMQACGIREYEKVLVANFTNGNRYETYAIAAPEGSGTVSVNGAGARYSCVGDTVTIFAFAEIDADEEFEPLIVVCDAENQMKAVVREEA